MEKKIKKWNTVVDIQRLEKEILDYANKHKITEIKCRLHTDKEYTNNVYRVTLKWRDIGAVDIYVKINDEGKLIDFGV